MKTEEEIVKEVKTKYGENIIVAFCPICDEVLIDDPFCSIHGDTTGFDEKYYHKGILYTQIELPEYLIKKKKLIKSVDNWEVGWDHRFI